MFKVECESCKATYPIDERRVPPAGLKMRCSKCGHSFVVKAPGGAADAPPAPAPEPPRKPTATILGGVGLEASRPGPPPVPPKAKAMATMVGLAPPPPTPPLVAPPPLPSRAAAAAPAANPQAPSPESDFPAALGSLDDFDLPAVAADLPALAAELPAAKGRPSSGPGAAKPVAPAGKPAAGRSGYGDLDLDLPVVSADLPAAKGKPAGAAPKAKPPAGPTPQETELEFGLPVVRGDLPAVKADLPAARAAAPARAAQARAPFELDLPSVAEVALPAPARGSDVVGLPAVGAGLPAVAAALPTVSAALPSLSAALPNLSAALPTPAAFASRAGSAASAAFPPAAVAPSPPSAFGEIDLLAGEASEVPRAADAFGEIDLPREIVPPAPVAVIAAPAPIAAVEGFGEVSLGMDDSPPRSVPVAPQAPATPLAGVSAGLGFGEVDLGMGDGGGGQGPEPPRPAAAVAGVAPAMTAPVRGASATSLDGTVPSTPRRVAEKRSKSPAKMAAGVLIAAAILGGAALQLTPYGAFGYLAIGDRLHAGAYARATQQTIAQADRAAAPDTYEAAKAAADAVLAAQARTPRAKQLTAYAALVDAALTVRFGADATRASHAKPLLAELPGDEPIKYLDAAKAAAAAANEEFDKARKALEAARAQDATDAAALDEALLGGNLELAAHDGVAATAAFKQAMTLSNDARAHFGLARACALLGDTVGEAKELAATLALSSSHAGALTMRARLATGTAGEADGERDVTGLLAPAIQSKLAPGELSAAYAAKAWLLAGHGDTSNAREAFAQSLKLDPRNVDALNGQGRLLLGEGRYTEALARFDKALQYDASSPETIANDAEAKLDAERPADAKDQLTQAKARFPKSLPILLLLGRVEQRLADNDAAEADFRAACAAADPAKSDAVLPYVALAELLAARGRVPDARTALDEAKRKLPASASLERAFGEVAEQAGDFEGALAHYHAALGHDAKDAATHFRLAGLLRRMRKFEDAGAELDKVAAVDKDYPGLSLERGLLFEQAGDVDKAIEQFKAALAKASDDPDLQLRVGEAYVAIGRADDAIPMLRKVVEKRGGSAEAAHYLGRALMLKGDAISQLEAMRFLKHAVELDPNRAEFHVYLAWAANDASPPQLELASEHVDKALALDKLDAEAYWQRGIIELVEGQIEDAIKDEKHALELRPSRYEAHATLAQCYEEKNDDATALAEWPKAVAGDAKAPSAGDAGVAHPFWLYRYGKLLYAHGSSGPALAQLLPAALAAEKLDTRPGWAPSLEFLTAESLRKAGRGKEAVDHYKRFLEIAPANDPDRADAKAALARLPHA